MCGRIQDIQSYKYLFKAFSQKLATIQQRAIRTMEMAKKVLPIISHKSDKQMLDQSGGKQFWIYTNWNVICV